jgi:hypothetical protein
MCPLIIGEKFNFKIDVPSTIFIVLGCTIAVL